MRHQFKLKENGTSMMMETYGLVYWKNCTMPVILKIYSEKPCGLKDLKQGGRMGVMSTMLFCHSSYIANCGRWFGWVVWAAAGLGRCKRWLGPAVCLHACSLAQIFAIAFRGLRSEMCGGWGVGSLDPTCDNGWCLARPTHVCGLARILAIAVGELQSVLFKQSEFN